MSTRAYRKNSLAHRNPPNPSCGPNGTDNTTILVRLAPDSVLLDVPFNRVTTWKRLIQTLYEIYLRNNLGPARLSLDDALECIEIRNDLTGGLILPELWSDFIKPQVRIAAEFHPPFRNPPWHPDQEHEVKREDDIDMMEGIVTYAIGSKIGLLESAVGAAASWNKPAPRLLRSAFAKHEESNHFHLLTAPLSTPALSSSFGLAPCANTWGPLEPEKSRRRAPANLNGPTAIVSGIASEPMLISTDISAPIMDASESPQPYMAFRNPFAQHVVFSGPPSTRASPPVVPQRFSPVQNVPASDPYSRPPSRSPISPEGPHQGAGFPRELDTRATKRKREEENKTPAVEGLRNSKSPFPPSSESNGDRSRAASTDVEQGGPSKRLATAAAKGKMSEPSPGKTVVLHPKILLLDSINAGEMVKVVRTNDGDYIAIRDDEEPDEIMQRRQSITSAGSAVLHKKERDLESSKSAKKRALDQAQTEELVRIWSGGGPEPPAKKPRANVYDKLTVDHKHSIAKFVHEQHIIRVDHFTAPVIQEWKARTIPDADVKQTEEYIEEIAANKYNDTAKRKEAYRLFMEHHNHSHKSSAPACSEPKA